MSFPKPTRVRRFHAVGIDGEHWFVEYLSGEWWRLTEPFTTAEAAELWRRRFAT
jgi:hypothetical protein